MRESCHQPPLTKMSGLPSLPRVWVFHSLGFGRGVWNTAEGISTRAAKKTSKQESLGEEGRDERGEYPESKPRTSIIEVIDVNGIDSVDGRELLVEDRPSAEGSQGARTG